MASDVTQKDIEDYVKKVLKELYSENFTDKMSNYIEFLKSNYKVLLKKKYNTSTESLMIKNIERNELRYEAPERIEFDVEIVSFYLALEHYQIPTDEW
jgi:hypothetical protein